MLRIQNTSRTLATTLLISLIAVFTVACGSSSSGSVSNSGRDGTGSGNSGFVGNFLGANNLPNNQAGTVGFTVNSNGQASGNYVAGAVPAQTIDITPGTYPVSGQVDLSNGVFSLSGNIPGVGTFTLAGVIPTGTNQTTYQFSINGQTFEGTLQAASLGTPNPPAGGGGGNEGQLIQGGTLANFVFTADGSYNGDTTPVDGDSPISGAVGRGQNGEESVTILLSETEIVGQTAVLTTFVVSIVSPDGNDLQVGQAYPLASSPDSDGSIITLSESEGATVTDGWAPTASTTGQATITARNDTSITIQFNFTSVGPNSEIAGNGAVGTFNTSGLVTGNFATTP